MKNISFLFFDKIDLIVFSIFSTLPHDVQGSFDDAKSKVRVRKKNKKSNAIKSETELENISASTEKFVQSVIDGLQLSDGEFMLAVAFVTDEGRKYHKLFPSVLGFDVVFGTNAEKRPQMRGTGKTSSNKNIPIVEALLPSQQKYIFDWFINDAVPTLLDRDALRNTKIIITDQDRELMGVIDSALKTRTVYMEVV